MLDWLYLQQACTVERAGSYALGISSIVTG